MAAVEWFVPRLDGDLADAAAPPEGCGADCRWLRQSQPRRRQVWGRLVSRPIPDRSWPERSWLGDTMNVQVGDTVRLCGEITQREFGLSLVDDDGAPIEIDAEVIDIGKVYLRVKIMRMMQLTRFTAPQEMAVTLFVRPENVLGVLDHPPSIWPHAAALKAVSAARDGKARAKAQPVFWSVGVDAIPQEDLSF